MEDAIDTLTRGNPTEVKVVLASVALALATYQVFLITIAYGKLRPGFLRAAAASFSHRAIGDATALILLVVAIICISYYGFEDDAGLHVVCASALLIALATKILVIRRIHSLSGILPYLGTAVWILLAATWATSAGDFLFDG